MLSKALHDFIALFATIDPIGTVLIFSSITTGMDPARRKQVAGKATLVAT
jgi:multiple antibiotic resistance protein